VRDEPLHSEIGLEAKRFPKLGLGLVLLSLKRVHGGESLWRYVSANAVTLTTPLAELEPSSGGP
jgi:hypothetical protein